MCTLQHVRHRWPTEHGRRLRQRGIVIGQAIRLTGREELPSTGSAPQIQTVRKSWANLRTEIMVGERKGPRQLDMIDMVGRLKIADCNLLPAFGGHPAVH